MLVRNTIFIYSTPNFREKCYFFNNFQAKLSENVIKEIKKELKSLIRIPKNFGPKTLWSKYLFFFGFTNFGQKKMTQKVLILNKIGVQKKVGSKKILGLKNFWVQNNFMTFS